MRDRYVDRCDLLNVINAYFSSYITCTVNMLVYNMVHIFACVNEWLLCCACPRCEVYFFWVCLVDLLWLTNTMLSAFGRKVKGKFYVFFIYPLWVYSSFWLCDDGAAFCGTQMHASRSWVWLSFRCLFYIFPTLCLWPVHIDLAWQNGPKPETSKNHFSIFCF